MDKSDFEVLLFKSRNIENVKDVVDQLGRFAYDNGYVTMILDNNKKWDVGTLQNIKTALEEVEVTKEMVKHSEKKVIILQLRGFTEEDMIKIKEKMHEALIEYDINVLLLDQQITLERADTFYTRIAKHLDILEQIKLSKKTKFKENLHK